MEQLERASVFTELKDGWFEFKSRSWLVAMISAFLAGIAIEIYTVNWSTTMQTHIPEESFSHVSAYDACGAFSLAPLGIVIAGPLAMYFGVHTVLWVTGGITVVSVLMALLVKSVRNLRSLQVQG